MSSCYNHQVPQEGKKRGVGLFTATVSLSQSNHHTRGRKTDLLTFSDLFSDKLMHLYTLFHLNVNEDDWQLWDSLKMTGRIF